MANNLVNPKKHLQWTVFISGFVFMVFEIVGSRVLAPFLGSSTVIWTSIIGVILASMSLGYWFGGKWADKSASFERLASILLISGLGILAMNLAKNWVLQFVAYQGMSLMIKGLISSLILFSIPSFFMAFVSPFAIRVSVQSVDETGSAAGSIYALSTMGSIAGTFFSGFLFIAWLGTNHILWILGLVLIGLAGSWYWTSIRKNAVWIVLLLIGNGYHAVSAKDYILLDTDYSTVIIKDEVFDGKDIRYMYIDGFVNSGMYIDHPNTLAFPYTQFYDLFPVFMPEWKNVVMFGGAGYSYPKHFLETYPQHHLDVVEIDPKLTKIAHEYFFLPEHPDLEIHHTDARYFMDHAPKKYDVVLYDVLTSNLSIPFHLTTKEAFSQLNGMMSDSGVVILNLLGNLEGQGAPFVKSVLETLHWQFPNVYVFKAQRDQESDMKNYMVVASKRNTRLTWTPEHPSYESFLKYEVQLDLSYGGQVLTDDYAPIDRLVSE